MFRSALTWSAFAVLAHLATTGYAGDAALGLPTVVDPPDNPTTAAKASLGKTIFFDKRFSSDGKISCASCHQPELAFTDGKALAEGVGDRAGTRNTPTVLNSAFNTSLFWDGRRPSLEAQALDPMINPREHGLKDIEAILTIVRKDITYVKAFQEAFKIKPQNIRTEHVERALASFQRTLLAADSPFDRYMFQGDKNALSSSAERGLMLFKGPAQCVTCHIIGEKNAIFTDNQFHSLGVGLKNASEKMAVVTSRLVKARENGQSLDEAVLSDEDTAELGLFAVTLNPADIGKFRTPSLRNVALTAPYMHDGSIATLEDAIEWETYYRTRSSGAKDVVQPLVLTPGEKADLIEFLKELTSPVAKSFADPTKN
ncbi:MAG: cytochrome c family protein [Burkholderiales bacterium]|jgi:cytochrome c peroxidase|nr:cytochrome c family protein [Burkholderiales bacterium]